MDAQIFRGNHCGSPVARGRVGESRSLRPSVVRPSPRRRQALVPAAGKRPIPVAGSVSRDSRAWKGLFAQFVSLKKLIKIFRLICSERKILF